MASFVFPIFSTCVYSRCSRDYRRRGNTEDKIPLVQDNFSDQELFSDDAESNKYVIGKEDHEVQESSFIGQGSHSSNQSEVSHQTMLLLQVGGDYFVLVLQSQWIVRFCSSFPTHTKAHSNEWYLMDTLPNTITSSHITLA